MTYVVTTVHKNKPPAPELSSGLGQISILLDRNEAIDIAEKEVLNHEAGSVLVVVTSMPGKRTLHCELTDQGIVWRAGKKKVTVKRKRTKKKSISEETDDGHWYMVSMASFTNDGRHIVAAVSDLGANPIIGYLDIWGAETGERHRQLRGHADYVLSFALSNDGRTVISGSYDESIKRWEIESGLELQTINMQKARIYCMAHASSRALLATGHDNSNAFVWDLNEKAIALKYHLHLLGEGSGGWPVESMTISPDSRFLACGQLGQVFVWDLDSGNQVAQIQVSDGFGIKGIAYSLDGDLIATGGVDGVAKVWRTSNFTCLLTLDPGKYYSKVLGSKTNNDIGCLAFNAQQHLASAHGDGRIRIWDLKTEKTSLVCSGHTNGVYSVAFSPDGRRLVSGSHDQTARIWDASTGKQIRVLSPR